MELLPETLVEPLPDDIPADELTVWEPLAIAVRWATAVKPGDSVAILGPGTSAWPRSWRPGRPAR